MSGKSEKTEMRCDQVRDVLDLLAAGDLPEREARPYQEHIDSCRACRAAFEHVVAASEAISVELTDAVSRHGATLDLWPAVQEGIEHRTRFGWRRLTEKPVRSLAAAAALTVGLYFIVTIQQRSREDGIPSLPVYQSNPVVVSTARVGERPARVSGFESGDGQTVFLWLE